MRERMKRLQFILSPLSLLTLSQEPDTPPKENPTCPDCGRSGDDVIVIGDGLWRCKPGRHAFFEDWVDTKEETQ